jgi:hypothetical protein
MILLEGVENLATSGMLRPESTDEQKALDDDIQTSGSLLLTLEVAK